MAECGYCRDCKWWEHNENILTRHTCARTANEAGIPAFPDSLAVADEYECFTTYLETKADFGCVMFEQGAANG